MLGVARILPVAVLAVVLWLVGGRAVADAVEIDPYLEARLTEALPSAQMLVIVHGTGAADAHRAVERAGLETVRSWDRISAVLARGTAQQISAAGRMDGVTFLEGDRPIEPQLDTAVRATRVDVAQRTLQDVAGSPLAGAGVSIAVVDTGVKGDHSFFREPDGSSAVVRSLKTVCPLQMMGVKPPEPCWVDAPGGDSDTLSAGGHGTHVAGIAAGRAVTISNGTGLWGVAPRAKIVAISGGQVISMALATDATYWVLTHHAQPCGPEASAADCPPIRVVNHSHGPSGGGPYNELSAQAKMQQALAQAGVVSVWSAGNSGGDGSAIVTNPDGQDPTPGVLMVANYYDDDSGTRDGKLSSSSSRGKRGQPDSYPDVAAPGTEILSSCLSICADPPWFNGPGDELFAYQTKSGTSMAAPHVSGVVALMLSAVPQATPAQIEAAIKQSAHRFGTGYELDPRGGLTSFDKGHGLVDAVEAIAALRRIVAPAQAEAQADPPPQTEDRSPGDTEEGGQPAPPTTAASAAPRDPTGHDAASSGCARGRSAARRAAARLVRARRAARRAQGPAARRRARRAVTLRAAERRRAAARVRRVC